MGYPIAARRARQKTPVDDTVREPARGVRGCGTGNGKGVGLKFAVVALALFGLWLLLSGLLEPLLLAFGILSSLLVAWIALRMHLLEPEPAKAWLGPFRCAAYMPWLAWQVAKSNADVALRILSPSKRISPRVIRVPSTQRTDLARTVYANSITLTPGTISIDVSHDTIIVHALSSEGAEELAAGAMGERVSRLEHRS